MQQWDQNKTVAIHLAKKQINIKQIDIAVDNEVDGEITASPNKEKA